MKTFELTARIETSLRYDASKKINDLISKAFANSIDRYETPSNTVEPFATRGFTVTDSCFYNFKHISAGDVPYSNTTLRDSGCAVFCFHQGLAQRGISVPLPYLAKEIAEKGYYEPGKGTYHNLFDHFGLRRISDYQEIIDALLSGHICTALIKNTLYRTDRTGSHFVNIVGLHNRNIFIDDSSEGRLCFDFLTFLKNTRTCWIW